MTKRQHPKPQHPKPQYKNALSNPKTPNPKHKTQKVSGISYIGVLSAASWPDTHIWAQQRINKFWIRLKLVQARFYLGCKLCCLKSRSQTCSQAGVTSEHHSFHPQTKQPKSQKTKPQNPEHYNKKPMEKEKMRTNQYVSILAICSKQPTLKGKQTEQNVLICRITVISTLPESGVAVGGCCRLWLILGFTPLGLVAFCCWRADCWDCNTCL